MILINDSERGFLFKNGVFNRMLLPGKHKLKTFMTTETVVRASIAKQVQVPNVDIDILMKDENFAKSVVRVEVPDNHFGIHMEEGRIIEVLMPNSYTFWDINGKRSFQIVDTSSPEITDFDLKKMSRLPSGMYYKIEVSDGEVALLYFNGQFQHLLESGAYFFWNGPTKVTSQIVDLRTQQMDIPGQEILTADKVSLRLNFVCSFKISDPVKITNDLKDYKTQIYISTQLVLREYVGKYKFDELLEQKENIAGLVLEKLREKQDKLFIEFVDAGLKDIVLPGEIRDIMNMVLIAEKKAQANVIARREEVASTRSLLNTAKLLEENATLYKLKELEYVEKIFDKVGNISVGNGNLLNQLSEMVSGKK